MKTVVIYASRYGCTRECAEKLAGLLQGMVELHDISAGQPDISGADCVAIGGSVYAGTLSKKLVAFCKAQEEALKGKRLGLFVCCSEPSPKQEEYLKANLPEALVEAAAVTASFGGDYRLDRMNFVFKALLKKITNGFEKMPEVDEAEIAAFAGTLAV